MSIQGQPLHYDIPDQATLSSVVINRGSEKYDPFAADDDDDAYNNENEQLIKADHQKQEPTRINNGNGTYPVINTTNSSSTSEKSSRNTNEQEFQSKSPSKHHHHHHSSLDRKRLRSTSPDLSKISNINANEQSLKHRKSSRYDNQRASKHSLRSPSSPKTSNMKKEERFTKSSANNSNYYSSNRNYYNSYRHGSSRDHNSHQSASSPKSSSSHRSHDERRISNTKCSSPLNISSLSIKIENISCIHKTDSDNHETMTDDYQRHQNRLKNTNDSNKPTTNKISLTNSTTGSQRPRSNLVQIVMAEAKSETSVPSATTTAPLVSSQNTPESCKTASLASTRESTTKINGTKAGDILMEEMLLEEEQKQTTSKSIDLNSLTIPETVTQKSVNQSDSITNTIETMTMSTLTSKKNPTTPTPSLTSPLAKKPYTLYKVPHTNPMTPLPSRHKKSAKRDLLMTQPASTTSNKSCTDDNLRRTSLDERISNLFHTTTPSTPLNKSINGSTEQQTDMRTNSLNLTSTPSDKSTESPQDITALITTMIKKDNEHSSSTKNVHINQERHSSTSKTYTTEWIATQKPEEAPNEELTALSGVVASQTATNNSKTSNINPNETSMLGKLSEAMNKLIQKQPGTLTHESEEGVLISAKHLERIERRKQREQRQTEIAAIAKEALKPAFKKRKIAKDEYKEIMKKVVTKETNTNQVDRVRINKIVNGYIEKYRKHRQQSNSKISVKPSNGNSSTIK